MAVDGASIEGAGEHSSCSSFLRGFIFARARVEAMIRELVKGASQLNSFDGVFIFAREGRDK